MGGGVHELPAGVGLELVPQVAHVAQRERERQVAAPGDRALGEAAVDVVEEGGVELGHRLPGALFAHQGLGDAVGDELGARTRPVPEDGEPRVRFGGGAAVQPEAVRTVGEQRLEHPLRVGVVVDPAAFEDQRRGRRGRRGRRDRLGWVRPGGGRVAEVRQQLAAVLGADRLGVELHPPQRPGPVGDPHQESVLGPGDGLEVVGHPVDDQRVVAHRLERGGNAGEQPGAGVPDP